MNLTKSKLCQMKSTTNIFLKFKSYFFGSFMYLYLKINCHKFNNEEINKLHVLTMCRRIKYV